MDVPAFSKPPITETKPQSNFPILLIFIWHLFGLGDQPGRLIGWELGTLELWEWRLEGGRKRPESGLWDTRMLKLCKIPTATPPEWVCLPSPFFVGLQSEPVIVSILVVLHILKAKNEVFEGGIGAKGRTPSLKRSVITYSLIMFTQLFWHKLKSKPYW